MAVDSFPLSSIVPRALSGTAEFSFYIYIVLCQKNISLFFIISFIFILKVQVWSEGDYLHL